MSNLRNISTIIRPFQSVDVVDVTRLCIFCYLKGNVDNRIIASYIGRTIACRSGCISNPSADTSRIQLEARTTYLNTISKHSVCNASARYALRISEFVCAPLQTKCDRVPTVCVAINANRNSYQIIAALQFIHCNSNLSNRRSIYCLCWDSSENSGRSCNYCCCGNSCQCLLKCTFHFSIFLSNINYAVSGVPDTALLPYL